MPAGKRSKVKQKPKQKQKRKPLGEIAGIIFIAVGIFLGICVFLQTDTGILGGAIKDVLLGLFGLLAYPVPFALVILGVMVIAARNKTVNKCKVLLVVLLLVSVLSLVHTFVLDDINMKGGFFAYVADSYQLGVQNSAGAGAVGCLLVYPFSLLIGDVGTIILFITVGLISIIVLANLSIRRMGENVAQFSKKTVERAKESAARRKDHRLYIEDLSDEIAVGDDDGPEILGKKSFQKKKRNNFFDDDVYEPEDVMKKAEELPIPDEAPPVVQAEQLTFESYEDNAQESGDMEETLAHGAGLKSVRRRIKRRRYHC